MVNLHYLRLASFNPESSLQLTFKNKPVYGALDSLMQAETPVIFFSYQMNFF